MNSSEGMHDLILGTAGHIDHGKTTLIRALTGTDTDRLPEEKRRGITIELGFARLVLGDLRLGIVDVPGHERFVRQMLAGATGMDLALLVVAADDSVNRQTREHFDILRLLDLPAGIVAVTKCDVVEEGWIDLVEEEIRELVAGSFLEGAPIVRTSAPTGAGLEELRGAIERAARRVLALRADASGPFRMPIDRCFTMPGHGTVVTGSVTSGRAAVGEELVIEPGSIAVRVRSLQNHERSVEEVHRGQRAAINLAGIHHETVRRGHELSSRGHLVPSRRLSVFVQMLHGASKPLKNRSRVRLHIGTAEVMAGVRLFLDGPLEAGRSGYAQFYLAEPVVATWNQPFVIRTESPLETIGGGRVLDPDAPILKRPGAATIARLDAWHRGDARERASAAAYFAGLSGWDPSSLPRTAGVTDVDAMVATLQEEGLLAEIAVSPTRSHYVHSDVLDELAERIEQALTRLHAEQPLRSAIDLSTVAHRFRYVQPAALLDAAIDLLVRTGRAQRRPRGIALKDHAPKLSQNEAKLLESLCAQYRAAGLEVPKRSKVVEGIRRNQQSVPQLLAIAVADGELVQLDDELYLHRETWDRILDTLYEAMGSGEGYTLSQIRELLGTTRKYAVPLCEALDRESVTRRQGDLRFLNPRPADCAHSQPSSADANEG